MESILFDLVLKFMPVIFSWVHLGFGDLGFVDLGFGDLGFGDLGFGMIETLEADSSGLRPF